MRTDKEVGVRVLDLVYKFIVFVMVARIYVEVVGV